VLISIVRTWAEGKGSGDCVFTAPEGGWISLSNWRRSVRWSQTCRGRRPYDLRHTAATTWLGLGIDVKTVQTWMGHASAELTLNLYGHYMGTDADRSGIARLNSALATTAETTRAGTVAGPWSESGAPEKAPSSEAQPADLGRRREPESGIEPLTYALRVRCSAV
jgi:Phage integrase family